MIKLAVIDSGPLDIAGKIVSGLREYGGNETDVGVCRFDAVSSMHGFSPDVLVLPPAFGGDGGSDSGKVSCGIMLLPGSSGPINASAGCVVTYGMSPKNTVTLSSIGEGSCVLALQRELLTAAGDVLERQEIRIRGGMKPDVLMAVMGALLICGVRLPDINP